MRSFLLTAIVVSVSTLRLEAADPPRAVEKPSPDPRPWIAAAEPLVLEESDPKERIRLLSLLGAAKFAVGENEASERYFAAALDAARALPDDWTNTFCFAEVARFRNALGQKQQAVAVLREGLKNTRNWIGRMPIAESTLSSVMDEAALAGDFPLLREAADLNPQTAKLGYRSLDGAVQTLRRFGLREDALRLLREFERDVEAAGAELPAEHAFHGYSVAAEFAKLGALADAMRRLDHPLGPEPSNESRRAEIAATQLLVGRDANAKRMIRSFKQLHSVIRVYLQAGRVDEALRQIEALPEPREDSRDWRRWDWCGAAHLLWNAGRRDEARTVMRKVLADEAQSRPNSDSEREADSKEWYGSIAAHFGLYDEAMELIKELPDKQRADGLLKMALEASREGGRLRYCPLSVVGLALMME
jgi:tetratricopeptide (TPR) repeat protein